MLKLLVLACILATTLALHPQFRAVFQWRTIDYNWPPETEREQATSSGEYIDVNNAVAGIKLWKDTMYLPIPRWKSGVPVTLAKTAATAVDGRTAPLLDAFPNWEMQRLGNCSALQSVQSMEIDPLGRMWVLDTGRTETMTSSPTANCPPRLVILDLENDGNVLLSYVFPEEVAHKESALLNDIVLDHEDGGMAYITESGSADPGIIVFSLANNDSWKVRHNSMKAKSNAVGFLVAGTRVTGRFNIDGIALSPPGPNRLVYYSPLSSFQLYSIPTSALKNPTLTNVAPFVTELGPKSAQTDGMVMTNQNSLYFGLLGDDAIADWNPNSNSSFTTGVRTVSRDHTFIQWPAAFGIDEEGRLWCVTNRLQRYLRNHVNTRKPSYSVLRSDTSAKNYQYFANGTAPELPVITADVNRTEIASSTLYLTIDL